MILNKKGILKQFGLVIYPVDYVVVIGELEDEVNKYYTPYEDDYNYIAPPKSTGCTYRVKEKSTGVPCIMVWFNKLEECTSSIVTHEVCHAAMEIFTYVGTKPNPDDQEPYCYLAGNLARLAVGCYYEIPGIQPPVIKKDAFENEQVESERKNKSKLKKK